VVDNTRISRYILKQKLAAEPVCIVWTLKNGIYADVLEDCGIWEPCMGNNTHNTSWIVKYPLMIIASDEQRYDMKVGDMFTLN